MIKYVFFKFRIVFLIHVQCQEDVEITKAPDRLTDDNSDETPSILKDESSEELNDSNVLTAEEIDISTATPAVNETKKLVMCKLVMQNATTEERTAQKVELVNASRLAEILTPDTEVTNRESEALCTVILFYSRQCPFSSIAAPHFNALARQYPDLKTAAVDSVKCNRVNTQYGIVGLPSIILFHNARAIAKFNGSEYSIQAFAKFIRTYTGIQEEPVSLYVDDFQGPVPSVMDEEIDYILLWAWAFILLCNMYMFSGTELWKTIVETLKNGWMEAEAQHEHTD